MTSGTTTSGSAGSGATSLPAGSGYPGYWNQAARRFPVDLGLLGTRSPPPTRPIDYLPGPAADAREQVPNTPRLRATISQHGLPGCWLWVKGTGTPGVPGTWVQARSRTGSGCLSNYVATPGGYVYVGGYWDYNLDQPRDPVRPRRLRPGLRWPAKSMLTRPASRSRWAGCSSSLFIRPSNNGKYYYGNYYGASRPGGPRQGYYTVVFNYRSASGSVTTRSTPRWPLEQRRTARLGSRLSPAIRGAAFRNVDAPPTAMTYVSRARVHRPASEARGENVRAMGIWSSPSTSGRRIIGREAQSD